MSSERVNRRRFLQSTGAVAGLAGAGLLTGHNVLRAADDGTAQGSIKVALVFDRADAVANAAPVQWAAGQLHDVLAARGVPVRFCALPSELAPDEFCVVFGGDKADVTRSILESAGAQVPKPAESLAVVPGPVNARPAVLACGRDVHGAMFALLELSDWVAYADNPIEALYIRQPIVEKPANQVRSIARSFASDVEDKPWYYDRAGWKDYFTMLARQRFNRFSLMFGLGYDFTREIRDSYFHFPYPFLVSVPGYSVRAVRLPDAERDKNLEMLRFISDEAAARGIAFNLGLWTHAYEFADSPDINYKIEGLSSDHHAAYCRDALAALLTACPAIGGITIRTHGESGVAEGDNDFWKTVFEGIVHAGRKIDIDMHPKGLDQSMLDVAFATGMPVQVSPKFWAEHMGLPYHQASIRPLELPSRAKQDEGFFAKSGGSRKFLRYGYGDLLTENRRYDVVHRIWPGTQRLLLWGDPEMAAAYARQGRFCGTQGVEIMEPLTFKGKKGTGQPGSRTAYADAELTPGRDWEKYEYGYCLWGRLLYKPDAEPETWRRTLRKPWGGGAEAAEAALAAASRILPLITTAHLPSAANNNFWPEMYQNMSILDETAPAPYKDTPTPKRFGTVSPLDPTLFYAVDEFAGDLLKGQVSGRYSPFEVAQWLQELSQEAAKQLDQAQKRSSTKDPNARRLAIDVSIQSGLGQFFAHKLRAAVFFAMYEQGGSRSALEEAIKAYRAARDVWAELARQTTGVYIADVTFGREAQQRGHWSDRLPAIDADIAAMEKLRDKPVVDGSKNLVELPLGAPQRPVVTCRHRPPAKFRPGEAVMIVLAITKPDERASTTSVRLHYRHVNQAESYKVDDMQARAGGWLAVIPGAYTRSEFPLEYFFELRNQAGQAWLYPGFDPNLCNQPYFVIRQA